MTVQGTEIIIVIFSQMNCWSNQEKYSDQTNKINFYTSFKPMDLYATYFQYIYVLCRSLCIAIVTSNCHFEGPWSLQIGNTCFNEAPSILSVTVWSWNGSSRKGGENTRWMQILKYEFKIKSFKDSLKVLIFFFKIPHALCITSAKLVLMTITCDVCII